MSLHAEPNFAIHIWIWVTCVTRATVGRPIRQTQVQAVYRQSMSGDYCKYIAVHTRARIDRNRNVILDLKSISNGKTTSIEITRRISKPCIIAYRSSTQ